jgi:2,3-bisphosphoglycerate-dependent phosphoglycerate mutase
MKAIFTLLFLFIIGLASVSALNNAMDEPMAALLNKKTKTIIYLVRHAEKVTTDPQDRDPLLTAEGYQRTEELKKYFSKIKVDALFSTDYQRTRLTLEPLAKAKDKVVNLYSTRSHQELAEKVLEEHKGQTVVIAAHSNTLLQLVEAFQAETDIKEISEEEYSYIFKITVDQDRKARLEVGHYGQASQEANK